ncbi:MAG TPA: hypothetical protein VFJ43_12395 [Bacteroidia bacterium]|nr:hypothetical protein [Bacteroidia bacterium]
MASARKIPFPFIIDLLVPVNIVIKPMFGCHAIYVREKIMIILHQRDDHKDANGVWIMTSKEHHASLKKEFPSLKSVYILSDGKKETGTQMIHVDADDFESSAIRICELILKGDPRIGRIPKVRKKKTISGRQSAVKKKSK